MEHEGTTGIEIACDLIEQIVDHVDGNHIMALGDVAGTNRILEFVDPLVTR